VYDSGNDRFDGVAGAGGGVSCNIEYPMPARATLTDIDFTQAWNRGPLPTSGEKSYSVSIDGVSIAGMVGTLGTVSGVDLTLTDSASGLSLTGSSIVFHASIDRTTATYIRITEVK
jgi:hypothetical protein